MVAVAVIVSMGVFGRADVVHLVRRATLHATGNGFLAGQLSMHVSFHSLAGQGHLTVIQRTLCESAGQPVQPTYCSSPAELTTIGSSRVPLCSSDMVLLSSREIPQLFFPRTAALLRLTNTASIQWPHIEDIDALHLSHDFETLETGSLFEVGGHGTGLRTRPEEVLLALDLYT